MADYGFSSAFLKAHPDVKKKVDQAIKGSWEMDKFLDALHTTSWWKKTSDAQKRFDVELHENRAEVRDKLHKAYSSIWLIAARLGVGLTNKQVKALGTSYVRNALSDAALREAIGRLYRPGRAPSGLSQVARGELQEMAGNYGVKIGGSALASLTKNVVMGRRTVEDFEEYFRAQARRSFPAVADQLDKGFTVRQILEPYLQMAASEVGVNPATIDITNGMWNAPIQYVTPKTAGKPGASHTGGPTVATPAGPRAMTFDEWTSTLRTDTRYGFDRTQGAQKQASILSGQLMEAFGAMG